jgi:uncharacterized protein
MTTTEAAIRPADETEGTDQANRSSASARAVPRTAQLAFTGGTAVLAAHVLVSAFITPRPGTTSSDHIVSALVPLALVGLAAWLFPRLTPVWQAGMSLVLGVITLVGGAVALNGGRGLSGWTGVLLVPAGMALVGLGVWLLWKGRRRDGHRVLRALVLAVAIVLGAYIIVLPISMAIIATNRPVKSVPAGAAADLGRPARDVTVQTTDGLTLRGWYVPSENGAAVLTFPREWTSPQARLLVRHGYGVLLLDMRGYGGSQGDPHAFGWGSTADVKAGLDFLETQPDVREGGIGGLGLSVGGEQLIETAAADLRLQAVVSDGAGERSVRESLVRGPRGWAAVPSMAVQTAALSVLSGRAPPPSLEDRVARLAPRPLFLIHAENGGGGEELTPQYYAAAGQPKQQWLVPGASHTGGLTAHPEEYERRVIRFFDEALLGR